MKNCKPGDKNYNCVENSPEYFRMEGLIVGSTNRLNLNKTTRKGEDNFYKTIDLNIKVLNRNKIWGSKVFLDSLNYDKEYVEKLNSWESKVFEKTEEKKVDNKGKKK